MISAMVILSKRKSKSRLLSRISHRCKIEEKHMSALHAKSSRYLVALAATAVALTAGFMLDPSLGDVAPLLVFTLSVVVAAWYGGLGPGLLATVLGALLGAYFFIEPFYSFRIYDVSEQIEELLFMGIGISISVLSQAR